MMKDGICPSELCTSCYVCMEQCKFNAITLAEQVDGRVIPKIDHSKCINCGACRRVCPNQNEVQLNTVKTHASTVGVSVCYGNVRQTVESVRGGISPGMIRR